MNNKRSKNKPTRAKPKGFAGALRDLQLASFSYAGSIRPGTQSPQKTVNSSSGILTLPDYSQDGMVRACMHEYTVMYTVVVAAVVASVFLSCDSCTTIHNTLHLPLYIFYIHLVNLLCVLYIAQNQVHQLVNAMDD
jgi:hypothetical protein